MRPRPPFVLALGLFIMACVPSVIGEATERQNQPDLTGVWLINWELSDNPRPQVPTAGDEGRRGRPPVGLGGGFGVPGRGGFGGRGGGFGASPEGQEKRSREFTSLREAISDLLTAPREMTITHDAREVLIAYDDGRYMRLVPDNREHAGMAAGVSVTRKTNWVEDTLVAEVKLRSNQKIVHELALRLDGEQLVITVTLEPRGSQDELQLRRVYDAAPRS